MRKCGLLLSFTLSLSLSAADTNDSDTRDLRIGDVFIKVRDYKDIASDEIDRRFGTFKPRHSNADREDALIIFGLCKGRKIITKIGTQVFKRRSKGPLEYLGKSSKVKVMCATTVAFCDGGLDMPYPTRCSCGVSRCKRDWKSAGKKLENLLRTDENDPDIKKHAFYPMVTYRGRDESPFVYYRYFIFKSEQELREMLHDCKKETTLYATPTTKSASKR